MNLIISYDKTKSVHDVLALKSVFDVVALNNYYRGETVIGRSPALPISP